MRISRQNTNGTITPFDRPDRWTFEKREMEKELAHKEMILQEEKFHFEKEFRKCASQLRHAEKALLSRDEAWSKERGQLVSQISSLNTDLLIYQNSHGKSDTNVLVELLKNEKKKLELLLSEKESHLMSVEKQLSVITLNDEEVEVQLKRMENLLDDREEKLVSAQSRISDLQNQLGYIFFIIRLLCQ
jgi:chromosome segregation ATPase